jgi:hypothetical protein
MANWVYSVCFPDSDLLINALYDLKEGKTVCMFEKRLVLNTLKVVSIIQSKSSNSLIFKFTEVSASSWACNTTCERQNKDNNSILMCFENIRIREIKEAKGEEKDN